MASYIRTEAGKAAVTNARVFLPHRLRALLAAIDGRTDPRDYAAGAWSPSEVHAMLESLVKAGYVARVEAAPAAAAAPAARAVTSTPAAAAGPTAAAIAPRPATPVRAAATAPAHATGDALRDALAAITDFTMTHLPDEALMLLFPLEGAGSPEALRAQLGEYEARVARLGAVGRQHLAELNALLAGASLSQPTP